MHIPPGTRLGPYEIVAPLGAGGMGEVYRARDTRLGRDVAIKTLPAAFAQDPERRARFETEARAIAALSHPNVLAIHDFGASGGTVFAVMELVEGETLRDLLQGGPLTGTRATALAIQIASGLAAAHDRGVIHRDLKPENIIVTPEGQAKILDFGLARRVAPVGEDSQSLAPTQAAGTEPGMVMGTAGYMSPEQVRGQVADVRSDLFSLGVLLYEMLSGHRAFHAETPADTLSAILREDPPELSHLVPSVPPALERIVRRCLQKNPAARFRSAADLAFALEAASTASGASAASGSASVATAPAAPTFRRVTYRTGFVNSARFTPDGGGVAFSAAWAGSPFEAFTAHPGNPAARSLGLRESTLLAVSATGELALALGFRHHFWTQSCGTLARVALAGGGTRALQEDVGHADWSPDGKALAFTRYTEGRCRLEYPSGHVLFETPGWLSQVRVSPDGRCVAFAYHPILGDMGGDVCVVEAAGAHRALLPGMTSVSGIAWSPAGDELWCSGINEQERHGIWAVSLDGQRRDVHASAGRVWLHDIARDGRVLLGSGTRRIGLNAGGEDAAREVDMAWFDSSVALDLSADGHQVLLYEADEAENPHYAIYVRGVDGSPAVRLGEGTGTRMSADGAWVLGILNRPSHALVLYPTGVGEPRSIAFEGIDHIVWAGFHPDGRHVFAVGSTAERSKRLYLLPIEAGTPRLLRDEEIDVDRVAGLALSPDGERLVLRRVSGEHVMFTCASGATEPIRGITPGEYAMRFDTSGRFLYVACGVHLQQRLDRLDLESGERTPCRAIQPPDPTGITFVGRPVVSADGSRYAYSFMRQLSDLYVVEGLA